MKEVTIPHKFTPRDYQRDFFEAMEHDGYKRAILVWPRRHGKDKTCFAFVLRQMMRRVGNYAYIFPTASLARKAAWQNIDADGFKLLDHIPPELIARKQDQSMHLELVNGSTLTFFGSDRQVSVGTNYIGIVLSEFAIQDPTAWNLLRPVIRQNKGWVVMNSTPRGRNHYHDMYHNAKDNDEWYTSLLTADDTDVFTPEDIQAERDSGMSEEVIQQEFYCFPSGQFVMTSIGMIDIKDVNPGDLVLTHKGRYRKVLETHERKYSGELIKIKSYGSCEDLLCTPNHPVRVYERHAQSYRWIKAEHIIKKYRLCFPKLLFGGRPILEKPFAMLMAWYICEGSASSNGIQFSVGNNTEVERITSYLDDLAIKYSVNKTETGINVVVCDVHLLDFFKIYCGTKSDSKKIPLHIISGHEKAFLYELMLGDGCIHKNRGVERWSYSTVSKTLAYQVQLLANSLCYTAGITKRKGGKSKICDRDVNTKDSYCVQVGSVEIRQESTVLIRAKNSVAACVLNTSKEPFNGTVYNLKVQYDESYTVNGRSVHNCSFTRGIEGSYYGRLIDKMRIDGRICRVYPEVVKTYAVFDLGMNDSTSIIVWQHVNQEIHIIDHYENNGEAIEHYVRWLRSLDYLIDDVYLPHDAKVRELSTGQSRMDAFYKAGVSVSLVPNVGLLDGIETTRQLIPRCWIDEVKCRRLTDSLEMYAKEFSEKFNVYSDRPNHNQFSHNADAMRYLAVVVAQGVCSGSSKISEYNKTLVPRI